MTTTASGRCPECSFDWTIGPAEAKGLLATAPGAYRRLLPVEVLDQQEVCRRRPAPTVWSALEYVAHTRDAFSWYDDRVGRVLSEALPRLAGFDWDAAAERRRYRDEDPAVALATLCDAWSALVQHLECLESDDWGRRGIGSEGGLRTVLDLARRAAHEAVHHRLDVDRALREGNAHMTAGAGP